MNNMKNKPKYKLIQKTIFFPKQGILAFGDLHLGYDSMLKNQGINISYDELEETKKELELIIKKVKALYTLKKIVLLGDIKHYFSFNKEEVFDVSNFLKFLEKFVSKDNLILIKGNHDTFTLKDYELKNFYISEGADGKIAFTHGDKNYPEIYGKGIKTVVIGHIHPAVLLKDKNGIKKEKFKCFLIGKYKGKEFIVVPSFFPMFVGTEIYEGYVDKKGWSILPKYKMKGFDTFIVGKNKVYGFGKFGDI